MHSVVNDGMDIAFCRWNYKDPLLYAGAFNRLYILRNGAFIEYKVNPNGQESLSKEQLLKHKKSK